LKKMLSIILTAVFILSFASLASAMNNSTEISSEDLMQSEKYVVAYDVRSQLSISNGIATCRYGIDPSPGYTATIRADLQRSSGSSWSTIKSWSEPKASRHDKTKTCSVVKGYSYRLYVFATVYDSKNKVVENITVISNTVRY